MGPSGSWTPRSGRHVRGWPGADGVCESGSHPPPAGGLVEALAQGWHDLVLAVNSIESEPVPWLGSEGTRLGFAARERRNLKGSGRREENVSVLNENL
jgi:hypothetical protein